MTPELSPEVLEQNPLLAVAILFAFGALVTGLAASLTCWAWLVYRLWHRQPILPVREWSPRTWGLVEILLAGCLMFAMQVLMTSLAVPLLGIDLAALREGGDPPLSFAAVISLSYLLTTLLMVGWIMLRFQVPASHTGFETNGLPRQIVIGVLAGFIILPLVMLLNAFVTLGLEQEYDHPVLDAMASEGTLSGYFLAVFSAVLVAPIAEEFLFRGLLQGWLQSIEFSSPLAAILGATRTQRSTPPPNPYYHPSSAATAQPEATLGGDAEAAEAPVTQATESGLPDNPYAVSETAADWTRAPERHRPSLWPSLVSGTLFGLAHWGYGFSFIPLIALGIGLGLLYRATQSIWPCIVVHFMLNAFSMGMLGLGVYIQQVAGG